MNLHQTQSIQTMCELMDFAAVPYHIITPKDGKNIIDFVQDTMLASYRLTKDHVRIREKSMANLQMVNSYFNGKLPTPVDKDHHLYTGKQAYSAILPPGLMMEGKNRTGQKVIVYNGELKEGTLDKGVYNAMSEGLIPRIFHDYGPFEARRFLDNTQRLMCRWLMMSGFSCGISDLVIEPKTVDKFKTIVQTMKEQAYRRIQEVRSGGLDNHSIFKNNEFFEMELVSKLQAAFDEIGSEGLNQINDLTNRMINMVKSGSKGSEMNVAQMIGALGQQLIDGKRIQYGFTDRTLPHYTKFDDGPEARGFVENSFIKGLEPHEVFFHAMGGREGLIDTAVKSVSGETPIVVMENGKARYVEIGDWIDRYMETYPKEIVVEDDRPDLEFLKIDDKVEVYIPTVDDKGTVTWGQLTAVTRHDPTEVVYEVETAGGRKVTVADSESLLIWDSKKEGYYKKHSSLVCEGDLVPVTMNLVKPPQVTEYVDMTEYFPKTEYVYGTEFNKCVQLMKEAQGDKFHIPRGWYEENNGKTFTLPYISKARVQRVTVRSNTENMREDCIYPYHATREHSHLPDKFMLDYDNGVFVGLYLADGCFHEDSGTISIAKDDKSVQEFVGKWFDKYGITHRIDVCKKERGTSTSIIGSSTLFARFIHKFVGHGARNKHIPDVAYTAPEEFVKGLLSGYISGDGCIQRGGVSTLSVSRRLTEGISYLCSRLGIFGKITTTQQKKNNLGTTDIAPMHHLSIRAQWARLLSKEINLVHTIKNEKLKTMKFAEEHANFKEKKDTVMDTIVKIKRVNGMERCKKMYDVTVPSTLNFVTGNGLGHRDTSETGYIQRRMVKAMEDCKVYYDNTVRNATGSVVQFVYGEDGMDGTKLEQQQIPYIQQSLLEMDHQYHLRKGELPEIFFTKDAYTEIQKSDWEERSTEHYKKMVEDREFLITKVFKNMLNGSVIYPIPFKRLIRTAALKVSQVNLDSVPNTLTPMEILDTIDRLMDKLHVADKEQGTQYLHILLRLHLNPKMILLTHRLTKPVFEWVVAEIERYFYAAVVQPGETVGIIAAQSIGEPCTQLSANRETVIRVLGEENFTGPVYKFIDKLLEKNPEKVIDLGSGSVVMNMDEDYYIVGVSDTEKTSWKRISQISRHYANGRLMTVHTRSGKKTTATMSHSFLKRTVDKIVPIEGTHLKVGDRIPVAKYIPEMEHAQTHIRIRDRVFPLDKEFGWVIGAYLADGNINGKTIKISKMEPIFEEKLRAFGYKYGYDLNIKERLNHIQGNEKAYPGKDMTFIGASDLGTFLLENFKTGSYEKGIPAWVYGANREFISGILSGYFDGDGNVNADGQRQCIRAHSVNEQLIDDMIVLLAYCGIFANKLVERRNREISNKFFVAVISKKYAQDFYDNIGLATPYKSNDLLKIIDYNNRENRHDQAEYIDKIPELGSVIAYVGKRLELPGQSRNYGRWQHKESIGRRTLERYITVFDEANKKHQYEDVTACIKILKQAAESHVIWDEIIEIIYHEDPKEFVYDFTVPGNDSFMVDTAVLVHNTLNSFHSSGTAAAVKATSGVPRLRELLSVSKNIKTPTLLIYLQPDIAPYKDKAEAVLQSLEMTKLGDILEMSEIFWDPPGAGFQTGVGEDKGVLDIYHAFSDLEEAQCSTVSPWVLRMKLNKQKMYRMGLRMMDIYTRLMTTNGSIVDCVFSDDNAAELILRIRLTQLGLKDIDPEDSIAALKAIEYNFVNGIGNSPLLLKGMQGIRKVSMRQQNQQRYNPLVQAFEKMSEWVLDTDGTNLMEILSNPNVDTVRTVSNDVREIFEVLGIEAARTALYNEIYNVIRDSSLNSRHLYLLVDTITNRGTLMSIDRHGINRADVGPLAKSSFEETTDMLIKAGVFSEFDRINGVSANIMLGQLPPCGTGDSEILLDEELFIQLIQGATQAPEMAPIEKETTTHSEACGVENLSFTYKLPTLSSTIQFPLPQVTLV
jgi:DNA-directed RNA polymerase beta' subunit